MTKDIIGAFECRYIDVGVGTSDRGARIVLHASMQNQRIRVPTMSLDAECARELATALMEAANEVGPRLMAH